MAKIFINESTADNNSYSRAQEIEDALYQGDSVQINGSFSSVSDTDWYDIFFSGLDTIACIDVEPLGNFPVRIIIRDSNNKIRGKQEGKPGEMVRFKYPVDARRDSIKIGLDILSGTVKGDYVLYCNATEADDIDPLKGNDYPEDAQEINVGEHIICTVDEEGDYDYFKIKFPSDGLVDFNVYPGHRDISTRVNVSDSNDKVIKYSYVSEGYPLKLSVDVKANTTYYVSLRDRSTDGEALDLLSVLHVDYAGKGGNSTDFSDVRITKITTNKTEPFAVGQPVEMTVTLKNYAQYPCPLTYINAKTKEGLVLGTSAAAVGILPNQEVNVKLPVTRSEEGTTLVIFEISSNAAYSSSKHFTWGTVGPLKALVDQYIASNPSLTANEKAALNKIGLYGKEKICKGASSAGGTMEYLTTTVTDMFNKGELLLFSMEGAGSYTNLNNPRHPNGRYGALTVAIKNKKIIALERETSTLPDYAFQTEGIPQISYTTTVEPGVYEAVSGLHQSKVTAIRVCNNRYMPSSIGTKSKRTKTTAIGINFHRGFNADNANAPSSEGCLLVSKPAAQAFYEKIGVVNAGVSIDDCKFNSLTCVVVVNRDLFNPDKVQGMA